MYIITGANGFIGSAMVWELNRHGVENIIVADPITLADRTELLAPLKINKCISEVALWSELEKPDVQKNTQWVIHMGACSSTTEMDTEFLRRNNTLYTQKLYEWCLKHNIGFIYASSAATYGAGENGFDDTTDSEILKPLNPYGFSKVAFDRWLLKQPKPTIPCYGLKFFNVFGPNENFKGSMSSVAFKAFNEIQKNGSLSLFKSYDPKYKDGEQLRDFVYVKDVTRWMFELTQKKPKSDIYNMGFGKARSWVDLSNAVFQGLGKQPNINWIEMPDNIKGQYQYFTEAKMNKWQFAGMSAPEWSLEKAVADYVQNYLIPKKQLTLKS